MWHPLLVLAAFASVARRASAGVSLDEHWTFVSTQMTWSDAQQHCQERYGGNLVSVHSARENTRLTTLYSDACDSCRIWTGLNDQDRDDTFEWQGGADLAHDAYTNWYSDSESKTKGKEFCVVLGFDWTSDWWTATCGEQHSFVCDTRCTPEGARKEFEALHNIDHKEQLEVTCSGGDSDTAAECEVRCRDPGMSFDDGSERIPVGSGCAADFEGLESIPTCVKNCPLPAERFLNETLDDAMSVGEITCEGADGRFDLLDPYFSRNGLPVGARCHVECDTRYGYAPRNAATSEFECRAQPDTEHILNTLALGAAPAASGSEEDDAEVRLVGKWALADGAEGPAEDALCAQVTCEIFPEFVERSITNGTVYGQDVCGQRTSRSGAYYECSAHCREGFAVANYSNAEYRCEMDGTWEPVNEAAECAPVTCEPFAEFLERAKLNHTTRAAAGAPVECTDNNSAAAHGAECPVECAATTDDDDSHLLLSDPSVNTYKCVYVVDVLRKQEESKPPQPDDVKDYDDNPNYPESSGSSSSNNYDGYADDMEYEDQPNKHDDNEDYYDDYEEYYDDSRLTKESSSAGSVDYELAPVVDPLPPVVAVPVPDHRRYPEHHGEWVPIVRRHDDDGDGDGSDGQQWDVVFAAAAAGGGVCRPACRVVFGESDDDFVLIPSDNRRLFECTAEGQWSLSDYVPADHKEEIAGYTSVLCGDGGQTFPDSLPDCVREEVKAPGGPPAPGGSSTQSCSINVTDKHIRVKNTTTVNNTVVIPHGTTMDFECMEHEHDDGHVHTMDFPTSVDLTQDGYFAVTCTDGVVSFSEANVNVTELPTCEDPTNSAGFVAPTSTLVAVAVILSSLLGA